MKNTIILFAGQARAGKDTCADLVVEKRKKHGISVSKTYFAKALKESAKVCLGLADEHVYGDLKEQKLEYKLKGADINVALIGELHHGSLVSVDNGVKKLTGFDSTIDVSRNIAKAMVQAIRENGEQSFLHKMFMTDVYLVSPRQLMQWWGTEAIRKGGYEDAWVDCVKFDIGMEGTEVTVISDARFENEIVKIKESFPDYNVIVARVTRPDNVTVAAHVSEKGLPDYMIDFEIYNDGSLESLSQKIDNLLLTKNWR